MSVEHVFVTRHGARIDNGPDSDPSWLSKAGHGRRDDPHLSPSGQIAAEELATALEQSNEFCHNRNAQNVHIISSPYVRCVETADAVAKKLGLQIKIEDGLSEVGTASHKLLPLAELLAQFPSIDPTYESVIPRSEIKTEHGDGQAAKRACAAATPPGR